MTICPYCNKRPLLEKKTAKTCGSKECQKKNLNLLIKRDQEKKRELTKIDLQKSLNKNALFVLTSIHRYRRHKKFVNQKIVEKSIKEKSLANGEKVKESLYK